MTNFDELTKAELVELCRKTFHRFSEVEILDARYNVAVKRAEEFSKEAARLHESLSIKGRGIPLDDSMRYAEHRREYKKVDALYAEADKYWSLSDQYHNRRMAILRGVPDDAA